MNLLSVSLLSDKFKSLRKFSEPVFFDESPSGVFDPICLVGLNGSGKSHFMELIAESFMLSEYFVRYEKFPSFEGVPLLFEIEYSLDASENAQYIKIIRSKKSLFQIYIKEFGEEYKEVENINYNLLPKRIIGYSSGLNETLSSPFLQLYDEFSVEISKSAKNLANFNDIVEPVRMNYLDSGSNLLLIITNMIYFQEESVLTKYTKLKSLKRFDIEIEKNIRVNVETNAQLEGILSDLSKCSLKPIISSDKSNYQLSFLVDEALKKAVNDIFGNPMLFFDALTLLSHLNSLAIPKKYMTWIKKKRKEGSIVKTPQIPDNDKFFKITNLVFEIENGDEIEYEGLSDGEHQLFQTLGTLSLVEETDTLFLFDEPDTHYNPQWKSVLFAEYSKINKGRNQEVMVSSHSPFIVSSVRSDMVYHFEQDRDPLIVKPSFETFGCATNTILKRLFEKTTMVPLLPLKEMEELSKKGYDEILDRIDDYGESHAKTMLYKKLNELKE